MTELLFIAITIFGAYAVFSVVKAPSGDTNAVPDKPVPNPEPETPAKVEATVESKPATSQPAPQPSKAKTTKAPSAATSKPAAEKTTSKPASASKTATTKATTPKAAKAKTTPAKASAPVAAKATESATASDSDSLKNPKTGEISKVPGNYAFAKRWIKDALVSEGLLDKVYKNTELDNATQAKIQAAIQQLKALPKYQA